MSFENSIRHHNFRSEMMSYANLVQNQMMIYQGQAMLQAQQQTNALLEENERIRRQEKQIDIWMEEFKHQGLSPIQAHRQALAELEIIAIKEQAILATNECEYLTTNAIEIVKEQLANKPMRKALLGNWSGKFLAISKDSDEVFMFENAAKLNYKNKFKELNEKLKELPNSKLFDDLELRDTFENIATTETPLEIIQEVTDVLDGVINDFNKIEYEWANLAIDFNNNRNQYAEKAVEKYHSIKLTMSSLDIDLRNFSDNLKASFKKGVLIEEFQSKIQVPLLNLENDLDSFKKLVGQ